MCMCVYSFFQARVSHSSSMCWRHPLRSPPYTKPSRWRWMGSGCQDVSTHQRKWGEGFIQTVSQNDFLLLCLPLRTEAEGGQVRSIQVNRQQHCIIRYERMEVIYSISWFVLHFNQVKLELGASHVEHLPDLITHSIFPTQPNMSVLT